MIEALCACGATFQLPESDAHSSATCETCGKSVRFVCAESLPDGAGAGDFDACLTIEAGPTEIGTRLFLGGVAEIQIGKRPECHVQLVGTMVSRLHCKLTRVDFGPSRWRIEDNASTNGLFVNNERVTEQELQTGDVIRVGDFELRYEVVEPMPVVTAPAELESASANTAMPLPLRAVAAAGPVPSRQVPSALLTGSPKGEYLYWLLLVFMLPLAYHTFHTEDDLSARFERTVSHASTDLSQNVQQIKAVVKDRLGIEGPLPPGIVVALMDEKEFYTSLPDGRIDGALLSRGTWAHWLFALLSAGAFFALIVWMFPLGAVTRPKMLLVGLFTGTLGIILLLGFQLVADWTQGVWVRGRGLLMILFYIVKFIGFSYRAALDSDNGFLLSFMGFTFGVGLCEELCKVVPLYFLFRSTSMTPSWRGACMWALASGVGFGVSEGITYSSDYYNGIDAGGIYLVRFASCVALHAVWAAAAGIALFRYRHKIEASEHFLLSLGTIIAIIMIPIILHGLYDTLLKKDMGVAALAAALVSFGWLAWQVERMRGQEIAGAMAA